jgi:hypothetical protein
MSGDVRKAIIVLEPFFFFCFLIGSGLTKYFSVLCTWFSTKPEVASSPRVSVSDSDPWRSEVIQQDEAPDMPMPMSIIHVWLQRCFSEQELDMPDTDRLFTGNLLWLELCDTPSASPTRIHFLLVKGFQLRIRKAKKRCPK